MNDEDTFMTFRPLSGRTVSALALIASLSACTPSTETEVAAAPPIETAAPDVPVTDIAAPTAATGPASANTSDTLSSTPPAQTTIPASAPAPAPQAPASASKAELDAGAGVYARTCAMCHGPTGQGVPNMGAALVSKDVAAIKNKVTKGTVNPGDKMPPMGAAMSASDLDAVAKYVAAGLPQ
jgi:mono/diheme cytochrome c family protein